MSQIPTDSTNEQNGTVGLPESDRHRLLSNDCRRVALDILATRTTPVELTDLARAIATRQVDAEEPDREDVNRFAITLHHRHLPKMADLGVIEYDFESKRITSIQ